MTDTQDLRKLAEAATPGPWAFGTFHRLLVVPFWKGVPDKRNPIADFGLGDISWTGDKQAHHNAVFVASANPTTTIALLDALEAAQAEIAALRMHWETRANFDAAQAEIERLATVVNLQVENYAELKEQYGALEGYFYTVTTDRDAALARLAEMTTQEPVCFVPTYALEQMEEGMEPPHQLYKKQNSHATLPLFASAGASPEPSALQAENANLITALAVCRGAFPVPYADSRLYDWYVGAMADPLAVPDYVKACVGASPVQPSQCLQSVADALTIEQLNDKVERLMAVQPAQNHIEQYLEMVSTQPARVPWWMPIESAPKDGTRVLIKADCTVVAGWQNVFDDTFGWVVINDVWVPEHIATHWQPLPAAPSTKEQRNA